jgi:transcriptional regulator with XRE-family HTH domain
MQLGLTQRELAEALNAVSSRATLTRHEVSRWERAEVTPRYWLRHLAAVLDVPLPELRLAARSLGAAPASPVRIAHEWLLADPPQIVARQAGRRVGAALVEQLRARAAELRRIDDHLAGGDTHHLVARELHATVGLIDSASFTETTGRALLAVGAELAQLAGWVSADAGRHREAGAHYLRGVQLATLAGDRASAANNLSSLAYLTANTGETADAVLLARSAAAGAATAPPKVRALLAERVAWAHAKAGDIGASERALGQVDELLDSADAADAPDWVYWLDRREADVMAGRCYTDLHRPLRAVPLLEQANGEYRDDAPRELALYLSWLAIAYADALELEQACRTAAQMAVLAGSVRSARARVRSRRVLRRLREFRNEPRVRELTDQIGMIGNPRA